MNPAGVLLFLFGLAIVAFPEKLLRMFFLGLLQEGTLSSGGILFYRLIGGFFVFAGLAVAVGM
ncbi:hypothetical protein [Natrialba hulunbeirensis]|nr:hypothetical protein [Natrialba hulunbeirensis]